MTVKELRVKYYRGSSVERALFDCAEALETWRDAVCIVKDDSDKTSGVWCVGDNHIETCPVEIARQGLIAADDQRSKLR